MGARRGFQIGLEADGVEYGVRREAPRDVVAPGGRGVDGGERRGDAPRVVGLGAAPAQLLLPQEEFARVEIVHRDKPGFRVVPQKTRHRVRDDRAGGLDPGGFEGVAGDRRPPVGGDLEPGEGALDADGSPADLDLPDVGRDPAGKRGRPKIRAFFREAEPPERGAYVVREGSAAASHFAYSRRAVRDSRQARRKRRRHSAGFQLRL